MPHERNQGVIMNNPFKSVPIRSYEITPKQDYLSRRDFIKAAGVVAGSAVLAACAPSARGDSQNVVTGPTSNAKYVRFETVFRPEEMPGQKSPFYPWPYQEGLRMDEAMNDLAILATGLYGEPIVPQDGAPIRLVTPWKYGFKSIKSLVKIELVAEQPTTLWSTIAPNEYGFYANVNPAVDHPRWSQASERRIGELSRRATLPFNGYGEQVASLYEGMDLRANY